MRSWGTVSFSKRTVPCSYLCLGSFIAAEFKIPFGWWPCQVVEIQLHFRDGTGPWNVIHLNQLTWLVAREDFPCTTLKHLKDSNLDLCPIGLACLTHEHRYKHALWDKFGYKITGLHKNSDYWFVDLCTFFKAIDLVFIHSMVCFVTDSWPLPKLGLHRVQSSDSCFSFQYPFISFRS